MQNHSIWLKLVVLIVFTNLLISSENNNTTLLLCACEVIHLINEGVISPYVQEYGGILLKFNILRLHYVTHYCAWIECHSLKQHWSNPRSMLCAIWENNLETFKNCFIWFNHDAVITVISCNHYTEIFINFDNKRLK